MLQCNLGCSNCTRLPYRKLDLKLLSYKLLMLCLILSGQRGQTMHLLDIRNLTVSSSWASFVIGDLTKTSKLGNHVQPLSFLAYAPDRRLCIITVLQHFLERTSNIKDGETRLFLTLRSPHKAASKDTLRQWAREILSSVGVDMNLFKPHSVRLASTSCASQSKLPLDAIMCAAGWLHETTFTKYYKKPIQNNFGQHILANAR